MRHFEFITEATDQKEILRLIKQYSQEQAKQKLRQGEWNKLDAKIKFLKTQLSIAKDHDVEPLAQPELDDEMYTHSEWQQSLKPAIEAIKKDCKPYLTEIDYNIDKYRMFRGMQGTNDAVMTGRVRLGNRSPMNTGKETHELINRYFTAKFAEPFRNSMFVSPMADFAKDYGNLYLIFPRGKFTYLWSPHVTDMFMIADDMDDAFEQDRDELNYNDEDRPHDAPFTADSQLPTFFRYMNSLEYTTKNLKQALSRNNEVMVRTETYYGINLTNYFDRDDDSDAEHGSTSTDGINMAIQLLQDLL